MSRHSSVYLVIRGFGNDHSFVTDCVGFEPTSVTSVGFFSSSLGGKSWLFELPEPRSATLELELQSLLSVLRRHAAGIQKVAERYVTRLQIYIDDRDWISSCDPTGYRSGNFEISPADLRELASLGIGVTIHFFGGFPRDPTLPIGRK